MRLRLNPDTGLTEVVDTNFEAALAGRWFTPTTLGAVQGLGLDNMAVHLGINAPGGGTYATANELREGLAKGEITMATIADELRALGLTDEYITRVENALTFNWQTFWADVASAYGMTTEQAARYRSFFARMANMRQSNPAEFLSQIFSPTVSRGGQGAQDAVGALHRLTAAPGATADDFVKEVANVFYDWLDPSAKMGLLAQWMPEMRAALRRGEMPDLKYIDEMWQQHGKVAARTHLSKLLANGAGEERLPTTVAEFDAMYPRQMAEVYDDSIYDSRFQNSFIGPELRALPEDVQAEILPVLGRILDHLPGHRIHGVEVPADFESIRLTGRNPDGTIAKVASSTFAVAMGPWHGKTVLLLNPRYFADADRAANWAAVEGMDVLNRAIRGGRPSNASLDPAGTLYHEVFHDIDIGGYARSERVMIDQQLRDLAPGTERLMYPHAAMPSVTDIGDLQQVDGPFGQGIYTVMHDRRDVQKQFFAPGFLSAERKAEAIRDARPWGQEARVGSFVINSEHVLDFPAWAADPNISMRGVMKAVLNDEFYADPDITREMALQWERFMDALGVTKSAARGSTMADVMKLIKANPDKAKEAAESIGVGAFRFGEDVFVVEPKALTLEHARVYREPPQVRPPDMPMAQWQEYFELRQRWGRSPARRVHGPAYTDANLSEAMAELGDLAFNPAIDLTEYAHAPLTPSGLWPDAFTTVQAAVDAYRDYARRWGIWVDQPVRSVNTDVEHATQQVAAWMQAAIAEGVFGTAGPGMHADIRRALQQFGKMPTGDAAAYQLEQGLAQSAVMAAMTEKFKDAYRLQYYAQTRTMAERTINHPIFGIYPASYMWGKLAPEMFRFITDTPFGLNTGAVAYGMYDMQKALGVQSYLDPQWAKEQAKWGQSQAAWFAGYLLPTVPWDISAAVPGYARDLVKQGEANEQRISTGGFSKPTDWHPPFQKLSDYTSPLRPVMQVERVVKSVMPNKPDYSQAVQGTELQPTLEETMQSLQDMLTR